MGEEPTDLGISAIADATADLQPVDRRAVTVWRIEGAFNGLVALVLSIGAVLILRVIGFSRPVALIPIGIALVIAAASILIVPERQWRSWRYAIGEREIELRHGIWWQSWVRIPMMRIQHVDTRRGPLDRRYGLANLVLYTAAGSRQIPGLAIEVAEESRNRIAQLANVRDDV
jgi:membrane protein YdbS with pleckstrin-like domain